MLYTDSWFSYLMPKDIIYTEFLNAESLIRLNSVQYCFREFGIQEFGIPEFGIQSNSAF